MEVTLSSGKRVSVSFVHSTPFHWVEDALYDAGGFWTPSYRVGTALSATRLRVDGLAEEVQRRITLCEVVDVSDGLYNILAEGWAVCHPKDQFQKTIGRKVSLAGALVAAEFDYTERAEIWKAYLNVFQPDIVVEEEHAKAA